MGGWGRAVRRALSDLRAGEHREAYTLFVVGVVLTVLGLVGVASDRVLLSGLLVAVTFLVFRTTVGDRRGGIVDLLENRESFVPFPELLKGATSVWIYGPTATNVVKHAADIRQQVLAKGGSARVIVQDPASPSVDDVRTALDDNTDFASDLQSSLATLAKLQSAGGCEYRLLAFSPGFSMVVIDADKPQGYLIVEFHGFKDDNIAERMHLRIARAETLHWFDYWTARFEAMWATASKPTP